MQLEVAYDTLLMQAMQKRIKGEVAGQSVRFADVPKRRAAGQVHRLVHGIACPPVRVKHGPGAGCKTSYTKATWWLDGQAAAQG